jgi:hypothetical protein
LIRLSKKNLVWPPSRLLEFERLLVFLEKNWEKSKEVVHDGNEGFSISRSGQLAHVVIYGTLEGGFCGWMIRLLTN